MKLSEYIEEFGENQVDVDKLNEFVVDNKGVKFQKQKIEVVGEFIIENDGCGTTIRRIDKEVKTIKHLRDYLLENYVDEDGDLMLEDLDFSNFYGDVYITGMKVKGDLFQNRQTVKGNLLQNWQDVQGSLFQGRQGVQGDLHQSKQEVRGDLYNENSKYGGYLYEAPSTKLLKEVTVEELAELGYKLRRIESE